MSIADNIKIVRSNIATSAQKAKLGPQDIKLIAVTKNVDVPHIIEAINSGIADIGENRVQEAMSKYEQLKDLPITRHMIGHLQTNKVKQALSMFNVIQSVDSNKLAKEISDRAIADIDVMIEVNISGESSKNGVAHEGAEGLIRYISALPRLKLIGLMTIGPITDDRTAIRDSFRKLRELFDHIKELKLPHVELKYLSMGMSSDYDIAIEEGSNMVRVGRAIFGSR